MNKKNLLMVLIIFNMLFIMSSCTTGHSISEGRNIPIINSNENTSAENDIFKRAGYVPEDGFVPNAQTAIKIAEAVWLPIYGENIYNLEPFVANFNETEESWIVVGTLPQDTLGGVPVIKMKKSDGQVLFVSHGK